MDALKKAEAAKRQAAEGTAPGTEQAAASYTPPASPLSLEPARSTPGLSLEPQTITKTVAAARNEDRNLAGNRLPELPAHLENLDSEFAAHHSQYATLAPKKFVAPEPQVPPPPPPPPPEISRVTAEPKRDAQVERDAVRNVFEAKTAAPTNKRTFAIATGVITLLATLGMGGYFWWQLQPKSSLTTGLGARPPTQVAASAPIAQTPAPQPASPVGGTTPNTAPSVSPSAVSAATPEATAPTAAVPATNPPLQTKTKAPKAKAENIAAEDSDDAVRLIRVSKSPLRTNPALTKAYDLFNRGNFTAAKTEYENVLKDEPQNIEALHGMAAIAVRESRWDAADHFYERVLVADPKDSTALSALINLHGQSNPVAAESKLKGISAAQPDSADAQFSLGNLYASQQRWADAQQAYFKAYSSDAENPDILFNLAISLEHLNQAKLARQYYSLAIDAAKRHPAGFDPAQAAARLQALRP